MGNPVQDKSKLEKCNITQCCCFFTLRAGSIIIGAFEVVLGILWFIGGGASGGGAFAGLFSAILLLISGILILLAVYKVNLNFLWYGVYITLFIGIWLLISAIIMFFTLRIGLAIGALINMIFIFYCVAVLRSYAFEFGTTSADSPSNNPV